MTIRRTSILGISHFKLDFLFLFFLDTLYLSHATKHDRIGRPQRRSSARSVSGKDFITAQTPSTVNPCFNSLFGRLFPSLPWWLNLICCVGVMQYLLALFSRPICHPPPPPPHILQQPRQLGSFSISVYLAVRRGDKGGIHLPLRDCAKDQFTGGLRDSAILQIIRCAICFHSEALWKEILNKHHSQHQLKIPAYLSLT